MSSALRVVPSPSIVEQSELRFLVGLQNQIHMLDKLANEQAAEILGRLLGGSEVETGTHVAELERVSNGAAQTVRLVVR